jgi:hypothetical protein
MPRKPPTKPPEPPQLVEDGESREDKFCRLANRRVNHILHHTRVLGNLANRNNYAYTGGANRPDFRGDRGFDERREGSLSTGS